MINEYEYFSAFSRENRIFQRLEASNMLFGTQALHTSRSASPPLQRRGRAISASMEEPFGPLHFPHLNLCSPSLSSGARVPSLEQGTAGLASPWSPPSPASRRCRLFPSRRAEPRLSPALPGPATLRSKRPALGINTILLVTSQSPDVFW